MEAGLNFRPTSEYSGVHIKLTHRFGVDPFQNFSVKIDNDHILACYVFQPAGHIMKVPRNDHRITPWNPSRQMPETKTGQVLFNQ
jgi:hypothetical protein